MKDIESITTIVCIVLITIGFVVSLIIYVVSIKENQNFDSNENKSSNAIKVPNIIVNCALGKTLESNINMNENDDNTDINMNKSERNPFIFDIDWKPNISDESFGDVHDTVFITKKISSTIHELKILPEYFNEVVAGRKTFELRKNDRKFEIDDVLFLQEYDGIEYTGNYVLAKITYMLEQYENAIADDYVILSFQIYAAINKED